jgi:hypothetical protein
MDEEMKVNPLGSKSKIVAPSVGFGPRFFTLKVKFTIEPTRATDLSTVLINCKSLLFCLFLSNTFTCAFTGCNIRVKSDKPMKINDLKFILFDISFLFTDRMIKFYNT